MALGPGKNYLEGEGEEGKEMGWGQETTGERCHITGQALEKLGRGERLALSISVSVYPQPLYASVLGHGKEYRDGLTQGGTSFIYDDMMRALNGIHTWHEEAAVGIQNTF